MKRRSRRPGPADKNADSQSGADEDRKPAAITFVESKASRSSSNAMAGKGPAGNEALSPEPDDAYRNQHLTPHILRLLKLIQEGTAAHAALAASQLTELTADPSSCSPLRLWDILGCLHYSLLSSRWQTRQNAAQALQGVASHLPLSDQRAFFTARYHDTANTDPTHTDATSTSTSTGTSPVDTNTTPIAETGPLPEKLAASKARRPSTDDESLYLTVPVLVESMDTILSQGRLLLSTAESTFDLSSQEDAVLDGESASERMRLQRCILAHRLGLGGIGPVLGNETVLPALITSHDLEVPTRIAREDVKRPIKRHRYDNHGKTENGKTSSIRALLVSEIEESQKYERTDTSHRTPQNLLATELLYRMFDPRWTVRHGALLGTLSLLRAWQSSLVKLDDGLSFGCWPHDLMARTVCVLVLDRFGDFSLDENVVAPVREVAGQLVSVLVAMAPARLRNATLRILYKLCCHEEWEVRHGALIALKFITAVICQDLLKTSKDGSLDPWRETCIREICGVTVDRLLDVDDIKSVAAQILCRIVRNPLLSHSPSLRQVPRRLWDALPAASSVSYCLPYLFELMTSFLQKDGTGFLRELSKNSSVADVSSVGLEDVFRLLVEFLDSPLVSVRASALGSIGIVAQAIVEEADSLVFEDPAMLVECYGLTVRRVYDEFFNDSTPSQNNVLRDTWESLAGNYRIIIRDDRYYVSLSRCLLVRFFEIGRESSLSANIESQVATAEALLLWLDGSRGLELCTSLLNAFICAFLHSPWVRQFESACLLYRASLILKGGKCATEESTLLLETFLLQPPLCIVLDASIGYEAVDANDQLAQACDEAVLKELTPFFHQSVDCAGAVKCVTESWNRIVRSFLGNLSPLPKKESLVSLRLNAIVAVTILADRLPVKMTPLIRSLVTSLKNESDSSRQAVTSQGLTILLLQIGRCESFAAANSKVMKTICDMVLKESWAELSIETYSPATEVLQSLIRHLPSELKLSDLAQVWTRIEYILSDECIDCDFEAERTKPALSILGALAGGLLEGQAVAIFVIRNFLPSVVRCACVCQNKLVVRVACSVAQRLAKVNATSALASAFDTLLPFLTETSSDSCRRAGCHLLQLLVEDSGMYICPFVKSLLPIAMKLMTDPQLECTQAANNVFAYLVRMAPLVQSHLSISLNKSGANEGTDAVIDHLILGKPLPPCDFPQSLQKTLNRNRVVLRQYQLEGIAWLRFLHTLRLNGALCDSMGLGKTLQALICVAISHDVVHHAAPDSKPVSIVVCPSTLVRHWIAEINRFFKSDDPVFFPLELSGSSTSRRAVWEKGLVFCNIIVTSYSVLRSDIRMLASQSYHYCVLDEGHLLKNPKTETAKASRQLRSKHRLLLSGTPVQNHVHELWAVFDFLMPNFLGSSVFFSEKYARTISKGQAPGASVREISEGIEKLKTLHQQVLPFILRREKQQVLRELPSKLVTQIEVPMSDLQRRLYTDFCSFADVQQSLRALDRAAKDDLGDRCLEQAGRSSLQALLFLRLLSTHPWLVRSAIPVASEISDNDWLRFDTSGKIRALADLLRELSIFTDDLSAADNDSSLLYCEDDHVDVDVYSSLVNSSDNHMQPAPTTSEVQSQTKCLIFAQFIQSLDVVEKLLFKPHIPSLKYLRLDGRVPARRRYAIAEEFNRNDEIKVLLLTTRVGGLGLNLTGADTVIFLEHDFNPFADLQAMDRVHRIGQKKAVCVYRLVLVDSIDQRIMKLQEKKLAMSEAIVNADNSTMFSMGTDRLLDIFTMRSDQEPSNISVYDLDSLVEDSNETYESLGVHEFIKSLK